MTDARQPAGLDDVVCPSCLAAMTSDTPIAAICPACGYEAYAVEDHPVHTVREWLDGECPKGCCTDWFDVALPEFARWLAARLDEERTP